MCFLVSFETLAFWGAGTPVVSHSAVVQEVPSSNPGGAESVATNHFRTDRLDRPLNAITTLSITVFTIRNSVGDFLQAK